MADNYKFLAGGKSNIPLVGTDDEVKTQLSLLLGFGQLLDSEVKGLNLDFYDFIKLFEDGFSTGFTSKQKPGIRDKYWGQTLKTRPRVRVLEESSKNWQSKGYAVVELLPDRTIEDEFYVLFGTPVMLIQQVMYWMNHHRKLANFNAGGIDEVLAAIEREPDAFTVTGHPKVKLIFLENSFEFAKRIAKNPKSTRGRAQMSFRLMNKTNGSMSLQDSERLATKIKNKFVKPLFKFVKGKEYYKYYEPKIGDSLRCWVENQTEAKRLIEQTLNLAGVSFQPENARKISSLNPAKTYDDTPKTQMVLGKPTKLDKLRPLIEVEFQMAYLHMDGLRQPIYLLDRRYRHKSLIDID